MAYSGEYDHHVYRLSHRGNARPVYYDRTPYQHLEQARNHLRLNDDDDTDDVIIMGHSIDDGQGGQQPRRRIAVACARCRRRKIKCSGDTGTGQGCTACRSSGADIVKDCTFNRVGSEDISLMPGYEMIPESPLNMSTHSISYPSTTAAASRYHPAGLHRASLPALHTRSAFPQEADVQYEASPVEAYAYASSLTPRQDPFANLYRVEDYRSWPSTTEGMPASAISRPYDLHGGLSYGSTTIPSMVVPHLQHSVARFPSVSAEPLSSLNMGHLNTALPGQSAYVRRLPIPSMVQDPPSLQYSAANIPEIRPLQSAPIAHHINGIHSCHSLAWGLESTTTPSSSIPTTAYAGVVNDLPSTSLPPSASLAETSYGYPYSAMPPPAISTSPDGSPTTTLSDSYSGSSSMSAGSFVQQPTVQYSVSMAHALPMMKGDKRPGSSRGASASICNNLSSDRDRTEGTYGASNTTRSRDPWPVSVDTRSHSNYHHASSVHSSSGYQNHGSFSSDDAGSGECGNQSVLPLHQPQPQHTASIEKLCRQSPLSEQVRSPPPPQQQQKQQQPSRQDKRDRKDIWKQPSTAQARMSLSNFNAPY